jgi:hypothetical protein
MKDARDGRDDLFAGMRVEREVRDDGRYVIYFSWPEEQRPEGPPDEWAGAHPSAAGKTQPWNVSSGPPDESTSDQRAPDERAPRV